MRVRTQTILMITPIFTALGAAISLLVYNTERAEVIWGIEEEMTSLVIATSEYLDGNDIVGLSAEEPNGAEIYQVAEILRLGQMKAARIYFPEGDGYRLGMKWGDGRFMPSSEPGEEVWDEAVSDQKLALGGIRRLDTGELAGSAIAPVTDSETGDVLGMLEVITDAGILEIRTKRIIWSCIYVTAGLTAAGLLLSIGISGFLTRRLKRLEDAAKLVAAGDFDHEIRLRTIREVNDLGSIFNTMNSILKDVQFKAKNELVEAEQFRNPTDLADNCRSLIPSSETRRIGEFELRCGLAGDLPSGDFSGVADNGDSTHFFLGRVPDSDPLDATVKASAALFFLRLLLSAESVETSIARARKLFALKSCIVLEARSGGALTCYKAEGDKDLEITANVDTSNPVVLMAFDSGLADRIRKFMKSAGGVTDREVELMLLDEPLTAYILIQKIGETQI